MHNGKFKSDNATNYKLESKAIELITDKFVEDFDNEATNCKVERKAIYSSIYVTKVNKNLDNSQKRICLEDTYDQLIIYEAFDTYTKMNIMVLVEREENSLLTNCQFSVDTLGGQLKVRQCPRMSGCIHTSVP